jgi:hypothetical protein
VGVILTSNNLEPLSSPVNISFKQAGYRGNINNFVVSPFIFLVLKGSSGHNFPTTTINSSTNKPEKNHSKMPEQTLLNARVPWKLHDCISEGARCTSITLYN